MKNLTKIMFFVETIATGIVILYMIAFIFTAGCLMSNTKVSSCRSTSAGQIVYYSLKNI